MTIKDHLHRLVDDLPEDQAQHYLEMIQKDLHSPKSDSEKTGIEALEAVLSDIAANATEEDLNRFPPDFSENLDHYLYGTKKR